MSSLTILFQLAKLASCIGLLCKSQQQRVIFFNFLNSSTPNGDHLILLIEIGSAHKERMFHKLSLLRLKSVREGLKQLKMMMAAKWWLFTQLQK